MKNVRLRFGNLRRKLRIQFRNGTGIPGEGGTDGSGCQDRIRKTVLFQIAALHGRTDHHRVHMTRVFVYGFGYPVDDREIIVDKLHRADRRTRTHSFVLSRRRFALSALMP